MNAAEPFQKRPARGHGTRAKEDMNMKRVFYSAITGPDYARKMGEIMEAEHGEEWDGDVAAYLENLEEVPVYREGPEHIPGDVKQRFTDDPANICVVFYDGKAREIWWSDTDNR
jgi:hypothetical protein